MKDVRDTCIHLATTVLIVCMTAILVAFTVMIVSALLRAS